MKAEFINPFVSAAYQVLGREVGAQIERGPLAIKESRFTGHDLTVMIGVVGKLRGTVMYSMSEATAKKLVEAMLGQPVKEFDELAESGIAELGNVITGVASSGLEKAGYLCRISPPALIRGKGTTISTVNLMRLVVPLRTQYGDVEIGIALEEQPESKSGY